MDDKPDTNDLIKLCQWMLDRGRVQAERHGFKFDNRHPTYNEIYAAFRANDLAAAQTCYRSNFC